MDPHHHNHHHHHQQYLQQQQLHHHHHHQLLHHQQLQSQNQNHNQNQNQNQNQLGVTSVSVDVTDRFPQWSLQETKELLAIRSDLDQTFMETKRNKPLWEVIAARMKEKGFHRSADQCKCKWKNLVTRYKGCETIEAESVRQQFPFYNELQSIFTARMQRMLWAEAEGGSTKKKPVSSSVATGISSDEDDDNLLDVAAEEGGLSEGEHKGNVITTKKKSMKRTRSGSAVIGVGGVREVLEEFMRRQAEGEERWREAWEAREEERRRREDEWRRATTALEAERLASEREWRERDEQRRLRDEVRAEKRDALITALLNKLRRDHDL